MFIKPGVFSNFKISAISLNQSAFNIHEANKQVKAN